MRTAVTPASGARGNRKHKKTIGIPCVSEILTETAKNVKILSKTIVIHSVSGPRGAPENPGQNALNYWCCRPQNRPWVTSGHDAGGRGQAGQ